ncbi:MAG TPA: NAD(P)/FAD-dependent oxidoreductase [Candidatus Eremiobacteraceae bacterium]|nr:NAD(P)/FAD-dependent oxidoreductase [Candidatus Eremiobacteraceae bacterium]
MQNLSSQSGASRQKEEVVIVGGSAAGLFTAATLARGGRAVRVLESKSNFEPDPRTLIVTDHFRNQLGTSAGASILNEIRRFELFTDGRSAQIALSKPDLIIERSKLIPDLARAAQRAGAQVSFDSRFVSLSPNSRGLHLEVESGGRRQELHAASVVGADGATSRVARTAGWPPIETVPLVQAIVRLPKDCPVDTTRVWFVPDDTPYFYWMIPESSERAALGIIGEGADTAKRLARFLEKKQMEPLEWQGAQIPVYRKWVPVRRRVGNGDVYLVGDAAAQVKVTTVGGIVTGFRGAIGVAQSILRDGAGRELRTLRRELDTHWLIRRTMHNFQQEDYSHLVDLLSIATRNTLSEINRDESARLLWTVLRRQPKLALLGLRGLLLGRNSARAAKVST